MSRPIISVRDVGKQYVIGGLQSTSATLREALTAVAAAPFRRLRRLKGQVAPEERVWALHHVSFDVEPGQVVGVVGRNGAGKSTLLKILSRITLPTEGSAAIRGRVASLLEVGTGFHPELTGRENIYLNGAILGMSRAEINRKFDEIVDFSGVEKFLDTPVKRYSSGMGVRLAFAIAAHLEPEVLMVDEVLAVGDIEFQRKCLGKMSTVARAGRTILFVSHNLSAVSALCDHGIYLSRGTVAAVGPVDEVIHRYMADQESDRSLSVDRRSDRTGDGRLRFMRMWLEDERGREVKAAMLGRTVVFCLQYEAKVPLADVAVAFDLRNDLGESITNCNTEETRMTFTSVPAGEGVFRCAIRDFPIRAGRYSSNVHCAAGSAVCDFVIAAATIDVVDDDFFGSGTMLKQRGIVALRQQWSVSDGRAPALGTAAGRLARHGAAVADAV